jgi:hypothetical protein
VGNAIGVFQADEVCVFSIARLLERLRELLGCSVVEAAVGADLVVLLSPVCDFGSCLEEVAEPVGSQTLLPQASVEALHVAVLHGASREYRDFRRRENGPP